MLRKLLQAYREKERNHTGKLCSDGNKSKYFNYYIILQYYVITLSEKPNNGSLSNLEFLMYTLAKTETHLDKPRTNRRIITITIVIK